MRGGECDVVSLYDLCFSVNAFVCFVCCVCDSICEYFVKQFAICVGVFVILLLNVMELLSAVGGALLDRPCMVFQKCVWCACGPSECLDASSICCVCVLVCRKLSPHLGV